MRTRQPLCSFVIVFLFCLCGMLLFDLDPAGAIDPGELELEEDIGLAAESIAATSEIEIPSLTIKAVDGRPVIDGVIDEPFWEKARSFDLNIELYPERLSPAVVKTEAFVAATRTRLYVAFKAYDPFPQYIRSALREHDASKEDDYVSIIIDPTGSLAKKYEFRVNPNGTLSDVLQDTISDRYIYDWDTEWEGEAVITDSGYTVEIAIPANAIRIPQAIETEDSQGFVILKRSYPRSVDRVLATAFYFDRPQGETAGAADSLSSVSSRGRIFDSLPGRLSLTPHYIYHLYETRPIGGDFDQSEVTRESSFGLDGEYDFNTAKTLSFTLNPNFTEVEADIAKQSINNPFTIFQPEKRSFFKPVTEYYSSVIPVVYTRNIINPRWGVSFLGDNGVDSFSAFAADDRETDVIVPGNLGSDTVELIDTSYSAAVRFRRSHDRLSSGFTGTYRGGSDYHNLVISGDGLYDVGPDDKLRYQVSISDSQYPESFAEDLCNEDGCTDEPPPEPCYLGDCSVNAQVLRTHYGERLRGHDLQLRYKHDGPSGLYWAGYQQASSDYRADLGFVNRVDIRSLNLAYGKKWYRETLQEDSGKSRIRAYLTGTYTRSYEYDDLLERGLGLWGEFKGTFQTMFRTGYRFRDRAVNRIDQASLETGSNAPIFDERYLQWYFETAPFAKWKINLDGRIGDIADADNLVLGYMIEIIPQLTYRYGPLELIAGGTFRNYKLDDETLYREQFLSFTATLRNSKNASHRLLYLDDLTTRDVDRWLGEALAKEVERTFEYTFTYVPAQSWKILTGAKLEYDYEADIDKGDVTERQVYFKIEKKF